MSPAISGGKANRIMPATISTYQAKSGIRLMRMPGGRHFSMPTMSSTAAAIEATSMKERPSSQMSAPMPENSLSVASGGYMNQPRVRRRVEEDRAADEDAADQEAPEAEGGEPRERQVAGAQHRRQEEDRHRLEDRHGEQEHHHRAVQREDLVVEVGRQEVVVRHGELDADHAGRARRRTA